MAYEGAIYLTDSEETELELTFHQPDPDVMKKLQDDLQEMADRMGGIGVPELVTPPKGFLVQRLLPYQRLQIEHTLGEEYANRVLLQHAALKQIDIAESGEKMVHIPALFLEEELDVEYSGLTFHEACKTWAAQERIWYLRKQVAKELSSVIRAWNAIGLKPHLEDAFRPPEVQEGLFIRRIMNIARKQKDWKWQPIHRIASTITAPSPDLAGHQAGAAVDLRLMHRDKQPGDPGAFLDLGNGYPDGGVVSSIDCPYVTQEQFRTRILFAAGMRMGQFNVLRSEDWHGSLGDRGLSADGEIKQINAIYGPIRDFDAVTGRVEPYDPLEASLPFLGNRQVRWLVEHAREHPDDEDYNAIRKLLPSISF